MGAWRRLAGKTLLLCALVMAWRSQHAKQAHIDGAKAAAVHVSPPTLTNRHSRRLQDELPPLDSQMAVFGQAQFVRPNSSADGGGGVLLPGLAPLGAALVAAGDNVLPTITDCLAACRAMQQCNTFWYCTKQGGCLVAALNLSSPVGGCQLVDQKATQSGTGRPTLLEPAQGVTAGAPLRYEAPTIQGYDAWPGLGYWYRYDMPCNDSVSQPGSCGLLGGPGDNAARCDADPACQAMMWFPDGRDYPGPGQPVVLLKGGEGVTLDLADANINVNAVLYRKRAAQTSSGGALSSGAIAGIVLGVCFAALLLPIVLLMFKRRRSRKRAEDGSAAAAGFKPPTSIVSSGNGSMAMDATGSGSGALLDYIDRPLSEVPAVVVLLDDQQQPRAVVPLAQAGALLGAGSLPAGEGDSFALQRPLKAMEARVTPTPPPSAGSSLAPGQRAAMPSNGAAAAAGGSSYTVMTRSPLHPNGRHSASAHHLPPLRPRVSHSPPSAALLSSASPPGGPAATQTPRSTAHHPLLSHLPTYGWQRCAVDYAAIQFVQQPDGTLCELGVGASATVYRVLLNGCEPHAAKVFRLGTDPQAQLYFLEEASTLRLLRHKHIVGFAGVCVADGNGIILMELMEGGDLRSRNRELDDQGRRLFGWHQRGRRAALDIALALNYLHSSCYTHFDVKSRNVLLSRDMTAKLADVGFARAIRATHHSIEGPTGTFDYMAPELLTGRRCNSSVDIYSFGILLWEIVVGAYPSRGSMRDPHVPQECPQEVADLLAECLQEDPAARPTARQLVERLTALQ